MTHSAVSFVVLRRQTVRNVLSFVVASSGSRRRLAVAARASNPAPSSPCSTEARAGSWRIRNYECRDILTSSKRYWRPSAVWGLEALMVCGGLSLFSSTVYGREAECELKVKNRRRPTTVRFLPPLEGEVLA